MPSPVADGPARSAVSRREMYPKISANPRDGGGGGGEHAAVPPPRVRVRPGALPARVTPAAVPGVPPLARRVPRGGSGEGGKGCLSPPRSFDILEPLRLCPPPP